MLKIKNLEWRPFSGHINSYIASTPIGDPYCIWITDEGFKCSTPTPGKQHSIHGSLQAAKDHCQMDFANRILECIEFELFDKWIDDQGDAVGRFGKSTLLEVFNAMDDEDNNIQIR